MVNYPIVTSDRRKGNPLDDTERIARHYGITIAAACDLLRDYTVEELLPERGTGLETGKAVRSVGLGDVSVAAGLTHFKRIEVWDGHSFQTLWEDGVKYDIEVEVGRSWELLCYFTGYNPNGYWNMSVSVVALDLAISGLREQCIPKRYYGTTVPEERLDFNMGTMPDNDIIIDRITLFSTDYWTTDCPPESMW